jgi:hypothetical protein
MQGLKHTTNTRLTGDIVTWPSVRNNIILFLLLFSSLIATQPVSAQQLCGAHTGDLYVLPAYAIDLTTGLSGTFADYAYLTSVEPQTIIATLGQNVSFTISYQIWLTPHLQTLIENFMATGGHAQ